MISAINPHDSRCIDVSHVDNISEYIYKIEKCLESQLPLEELDLNALCGHNGSYYHDY